MVPIHDACSSEYTDQMPGFRRNFWDSNGTHRKCVLSVQWEAAGHGPHGWEVLGVTPHCKIHPEMPRESPKSVKGTVQFVSTWLCARKREPCEKPIFLNKNEKVGRVS